MLRLLYSSGLRRNEILNLKIEDIITGDGKYKIRINRSKGKKDRYTVLSKLMLTELREYYKNYNPINFLFNGRVKGEPLSAAALRHILIKARRISGLKKYINIHTLRRCFASHALEDGINEHCKIQRYLLKLHTDKTLC